MLCDPKYADLVHQIGLASLEADDKMVRVHTHTHTNTRTDSPTQCMPDTRQPLCAGDMDTHQVHVIMHVRVCVHAGVASYQGVLVHSRVRCCVGEGSPQGLRCGYPVLLRGAGAHGVAPSRVLQAL